MLTASMPLSKAALGLIDPCGEPTWNGERAGVLLQGVHRRDRVPGFGLRHAAMLARGEACGHSDDALAMVAIMLAGGIVDLGEDWGRQWHGDCRDEIAEPMASDLIAQLGAWRQNCRQPPKRLAAKGLSAHAFQLSLELQDRLRRLLRQIMTLQTPETPRRSARLSIVLAGLADQVFVPCGWSQWQRREIVEETYALHDTSIAPQKDLVVGVAYTPVRVRRSLILATPVTAEQLDWVRECHFDAIA